MGEVYSQALEIRRNLDADFPSRFSETLRKWVGERWPTGRAWFDPRHADTFKSTDGCIFRWEPYLGSGGYFADFTWRHPDSNSPSISWSIRVSLHQADVATVLIRISNTAENHPGPTFLTTRPRLVLLLNELGGCLCDGQLLNLHPTPLDAQGLRDLATYTLLDPDRRHPAIVLSPLPDGSFVESPTRIAEEFASLGSIAYTADPDATFALTQELGRRELSCFHGALRVYLPGFSSGADPFRHPLYLPRALADRHARQILAKQLALFTTRRYVEPAIINTLRDERAVTYYSSTQQQLESLRVTAARTSDPSDWRALAEEYARDNDVLRDETEDLRDRLLQAESKASALLFQLRKRGTDGEKGDDGQPLRSPESVEEAVELAEEWFGDVLIILPSARQAARESIFERPADVLEALKAMAEITRKASAGELGTSLRIAFEERGIDYRGGITPHTPKKLRKQYEFLYKDELVFCAEHIGYGNSYDPKESLRIYFSARDLGEGRLIVGHIGKHLDTMTTS